MPLKVLFFTRVPAILQHRLDMYIGPVSQVYQTEFWDLSPVYGRAESLSAADSGCIKIGSAGELAARLESERERCRLVIITNILIKDLGLFYPLTRRLGIPIVNISKETFYHWLFRREAVHQAWKARAAYGLQKWYRNLPPARRMRQFRSFGPVRYDYQLASCNFYPEESRHFVRIHHLKYDGFLEAREQAPVLDGSYILFIDSAMADHPMYQGAGNKIDRQAYLDQLDRYFRLLEESAGMPVVIAAHPKSDYSPEDFRGRKIYLYNTPVLIRYARAVVAHYSTSLIDVLLQDKPFQILYSRDLMSSCTQQMTFAGLQLARRVGAECINLEAPVFHDFTFSKKKYARFIRRYLVKPDETERSNAALILDFLKTLEGKGT